MKTKQLLAVLSTFLITGAAMAQTGGPDQYGYVWKSNTASGGPAVSFKSIKGIGTQINGLADDNSVGPFTFGWKFHYYWADYNTIWVGSNGWLTFDKSIINIASPVPTIPDQKLKNTVDPLLSDLTFVQKNSKPVPGATAWYWSNNVDTFIVQYDSVSYWTSATAAQYAGRYTFQVIFSGADSSITFQYKTMQAGTAGYDMATEHLSTGMANATGTMGLQVKADSFPNSNTAVKFYYPHPVTFQAFDATPAWNQVADGGGFFVSSRTTPMNMITDIANVGNQTVTGVNVNGSLNDNAFNQVWTGSAVIPSLAAYKDSVLTYPATYTASVPGIYTYRSQINLGSDINPANDITDAEMVVADTTQPTINLAFTEQTAPTVGLSWQGGGGGGGVYIVPPFYPATVVSMDFYILNNTGNKGFHSVLRDDDGPAGGPGTTLDSVFVPFASVTNGGYNTIKLNHPYTITSGGVYAGWLMGGDSIALGTDQNFPLSKRNYEIIGGAWASYRDNAASDLMIRVNINKFTGATFTTTADGCPSSNSGSATVNATGGMPPYTYSWAPGGQSTQTATGLAQGTYSATITDSQGAAVTYTVFVNNTGNMSITTTTTPSTCNNNGKIMASVTGANPAFTYLWSNGQTTSAATGLSAGSYTVTVTDAGGCQNKASATIISDPFAISTSGANLSCFGNASGIASVAIASGGTPVYTYAWSNGGSAATIGGLAAGTYSVLVTDGVGCTGTGSVTLTQPLTLNVTTTAVTATCTTCATGKATANPTGGTAPYAYLWSTGQTTKTATGLLPGTYTVCVKDNNGCTHCTTATVTDGTGINEISGGASITIQPNPFSTSASVKIDFAEPVHNGLVFEVYDLYGRKVQSIDLSYLKGTTVDFTLNRGYNVPAGLYFYKLKDNQAILTAGKIIVE